MYIVTTSKRVTQITVLILACLVVVAGFATYQYFQRFSAEPQALMERLQQVSTQSAPLRKQDLNLPTLKEDVAQVIRQTLQDQLSVTGVPDVEAAAERLLPDATGFIADDALVLDWLTAYLHRQVFPVEQTELHELASDRRQIRSPTDCLVIERNGSDWQLTSLFDCEPLDSIGLKNL